MDSYTKYIADIFEKDEFFQHFKGKFPGISDEVLYNKLSDLGRDVFLRVISVNIPLISH